MKISLNDAVEQIANRAEDILKNKPFLIMAIDGRCASGKTTLAAALQKKLCCNVIHMDDFFLRPEQRTAERLKLSGENIDHERFLKEVLLPIKENKSFEFAPFDCKTFGFKPPVSLEKNRITVVEGVYSCHHSLRDYYDLRIFLDVDKDTQLQRITARNISMVQTFINRWIPLEEAYFKDCDVVSICENSIELI